MFLCTASIDKPVDDAFVKLLKDRHIILCPTLVVFERYGRTFSHQLNLTPEEQKWGNPEVIASLDVTKIPQDKLPRAGEELRWLTRKPRSIESTKLTMSRCRI